MKLAIALHHRQHPRQQLTDEGDPEVSGVHAAVGEWRRVAPREESEAEESAFVNFAEVLELFIELCYSRRTSEECSMTAASSRMGTATGRRERTHGADTASIGCASGIFKW